MNHGLAFDQVAKYFMCLKYRSMPASDFTVNSKEWERFPDDIKHILKTAVRELESGHGARAFPPRNGNMRPL